MFLAAWQNLPSRFKSRPKNVNINLMIINTLWRLKRSTLGHYCSSPISYAMRPAFPAIEL
jgi:hypothetical protein